MKRFVIDPHSLPKRFPTHRHSAEFWEPLGRAVATFGFLEETLGKAIFVFTSTREIPENQFDHEYEKWISTLERALSDPLGSLIETYASSVRKNQSATIENLDELVEELKQATVLRNTICHGSWMAPDELGFSIPLYVNRKQEICETPIDVRFLNQLQRATAELAAAVVNSVTHMGWQFPGSNGPGVQVWQK